MSDMNNSCRCEKVSKFSYLPAYKNMASLQQRMTNKMPLLAPSMSCTQI